MARLKTNVSHDFVPNLVGRCDPKVEEAIRDIYRRFYKFGGTTIINNELPPPKKKPVIPEFGKSGAPVPPNVGSGVFQTRVEGYGALTIEGLSGNGTATFLAPSVDETDAEWYAKGSMDGASSPVTTTFTLVGSSRWGMKITMTNKGTGYSTGSPPTVTITGAGGSGTGVVFTLAIDNTFGTLEAINIVNSGYGYVGPVTVTITGGSGTGATAIAAIGRQWEIGDYILANDPTVINNQCSYEILQIIDITPVDPTHATFKLTRAQFGSTIGAHTGVAFYRLIPRVFTTDMQSNAGLQTVPFYWPSMTVPAITGFLPQGIVTLNFTPQIFLPGTEPPQVDPRNNPPTPGLRTMEGAAYINLGHLGILAVGQVATVRASVQAWQSIRTVYARVKSAPSGSTPYSNGVITDADACIVIYVCYVDPSGSVGLVDTLVIDNGKFTSYSPTNVPDGRQMPFHFFFPFLTVNKDWPPNRLPSVPIALNGSGQLVKPLVNADVDPHSTVLLHPDGELDFIVAQVGTVTAGSDLTVVVQT